MISASPSEVQPVLEAVAERAARRCEAPLARVLLVDGDVSTALIDIGFALQRQYPKGSVATGAASLPHFYMAPRKGATTRVQRSIVFPKCLQLLSDFRREAFAGAAAVDEQVVQVLFAPCYLFP